MITGKDIALAAKEDLESLFEETAHFELKIELDSNSRHHACISGDGENLRIRFSKDFCMAPVTNIDDLHFFLIIICHEFAHYLHAHNSHNDTSDFDSKSIEAFADFFGVKIMMTLITYGKNFISLYDNLSFNSKTQKEIIKSIAEAISKLAETIFKNESPKYSNRISRIGHFAAGITSFFDTEFNSMNVRRSLSLLEIIYTTDKISELLILESNKFEMDANLISRFDEIHKKIQGSDLEITKGIKPFFKKFIGTSYNSTNESKKLEMDKRFKIAKMQGFDIPELD